MKTYGLSRSQLREEMDRDPGWAPLALIYLEQEAQFLEKQQKMASGQHRMTSKELNESSDEVKDQWRQQAVNRSRQNEAEVAATLRKAHGDAYDESGF